MDSEVIIILIIIIYMFLFYLLILLALLEGEGDEYPEAGFYMMGTLEEAFEEGRRLMREAGSK